MFRKNYDEHLATYQDDNMRDFMDVYISEMKAQANNPKSSFYGEKGMQNFLVTMLNLFIGGSESTSNTLNWFFYYLIKYPHVQKKAQEEIDAVIGRDRMPVLEDRVKTSRRLPNQDWLKHPRQTDPYPHRFAHKRT